MTTSPTVSRRYLNNFRTETDVTSRPNKDITKCGQTFCGPDQVCMLSMCLCSDTHLPPSADGDCVQNGGWSSGTHSNQDGVLHPHHIRGILSSSSSNNNNNNNSAAMPHHGLQVSFSASVKPSGSYEVHTPVSSLVPTGRLTRRGGSSTLKTGTLAPPEVTAPVSQTSADSQTVIKDNVTRVVLSVTVSVVLLVVVVFLVNFLRRRYRRIKICQGRTMSGRHLLRRTETVEENVIYGQMRPLVTESTPDPDDDLLEGLVVLSASRLRIVHRVGDGAFGTVYKAWLSPDPTAQEAEDGGSEKTPAEGQGQGQGQGQEKLVAVKTLRDSTTGRARREFLSECKIMAALHHVNIITFHGVVLLDGAEMQAPQIVTEFAVYGDLATALCKNDPAMRSKGEDFLLISRDQLLWVCQQVAAGMEYLSKAHFIHRDLAARNCLLMPHLHVKISDFGMSRDIYTSDSYQVAGSRLLPVRWMSPECLRYGQFRVSSDVWAFGVLLWEVYTYGRQPYSGFSNTQVIQRICQGKLLERPEHCPDQVHRVMTACWAMNPQDRCSFSDICRMLQDPTLPQAARPLCAAAAAGESKEVLLELYHEDSVGNQEEEGEEEGKDGVVTVVWDDGAPCVADGQCSPLYRSNEGLTSV